MVTSPWPHAVTSLPAGHGENHERYPTPGAATGRRVVSGFRQHRRRPSRRSPQEDSDAPAPRPADLRRSAGVDPTYGRRRARDRGQAASPSFGGARRSGRDLRAGSRAARHPRPGLHRAWVEAASPTPPTSKSSMPPCSISCRGRRIVADGDGYRWAFLSEEAGLERALWPILLSAGDLLTSADREWVRVCVDAECPRLFVDRKSRRRIFCDTNTCGSRDRGRRSYRKFRKYR